MVSDGTHYLSLAVRSRRIGSATSPAVATARGDVPSSAKDGQLVEAIN